jgi:hypothetical protein
LEALLLLLQGGNILACLYYLFCLLYFVWQNRKEAYL